MEGKSKAVPTSILSAVFLSGFAVIKCGPEDDITVISKQADSEFRIIFPDGKKVSNTKESPETILKYCSGSESERTYNIELVNQGAPEVKFSIKCGKNGGWYIAEKFLLGGIISILVADCQNGKLWFLPPDVMKGKIKEIKTAAMIQPDSDELSLVYKHCVPDEIFNSIPFKPLYSSVAAGSKK